MIDKSGYFLKKDTREQKGWDFTKDEKQVSGKPFFNGTIIECLDAGDYTIQNFESIFRVERKFGFCELFSNIISKVSRERFERELEKLRPIKHKYLIIEGSINEDLLNLTVPQFSHGPPVSKLLETIFSYQLEYDIVPIFAGSSGPRVMRKLCDNIIRKYS